MSEDDSTTEPVEQASDTSSVRTGRGQQTKRPSTRLMVLLFTDTVGSVELKKRLGDAEAARLIRRHDELFGQAIAVAAGAEIVQDTGDGFLARFTTVSEAVKTALRFQWGIHSEPWGEDPLQVRVGLHAGEVAEKRKLSGLAVDIAARVMGLAMPGQILMTCGAFDDARQHVRKHPEADEQGSAPRLRWMAHGPYLFKGTHEPIEICEVGPEGLAPLRPPPDSEKARRAIKAGEQQMYGLRPAAGQPIPNQDHWILDSKIGEGGSGEVWLAKHETTGESKLHEAPTAVLGRTEPAANPIQQGGATPRRTPREIGRYHVECEIGRGGMGVVYLAHDTSLDRRVAIKVLPHEMTTEKMRHRFEREARMAAKLNHPNIAVIHELGQVEETDYIVMEYIEGRTLHAVLLDPRPIPLPEVIDIAIQIADGLVAAHDRYIIHRDLKPRNVMVTVGRRIKLLDFGLAKPLVSSLPESETEALVGGLTSRGLLLGTPDYMSPEQARGLAVDARSDLFSFGVLLYEMVTRRLPFHRATIMDTIGAILAEQPVPVAELNRAAPLELVQMVDRLLAKNPDERYQATADVLEDLRKIRREMDAPEPTTAMLAAPGRCLIEVLPFADLSPGKEQWYFCQGLADEIRRALSRVEIIDVAPGRALSGAEAGEAGKEVGTVLEGSVQRDNAALRVAVQLVDTPSGRHLWSEHYDRTINDVFDIQEEIVSTVVARLHAQSAGEPAAALTGRYTGNAEAYALYLESRAHGKLRRQRDLAKAIECLEQAIALDPTYAQAHAGLATLHATTGAAGVCAPRDAFASAQAAAERALALDPDLADGHLARAALRFWSDRDHESAVSGTRRAIELDPGDAQAHALLGVILAWRGAGGEAQDAAARARHLHADCPLTSGCEAYTSYLARQFDDAVEACDHALEMDPDNPIAIWVQASVDLARSAPQKVVGDLEGVIARCGRATSWLGLLGRAYAESGRRAQARLMLDDLRARSKRQYVPPAYIAAILLGLGQVDQGVTWLEEAVAQRNSFWWHPSDPFCGELRASAGFEDAAWRAVMPVDRV